MQDLLSNHEDQVPVVFFRDVSFSEMEALVKYIYTGEVEVPGSSLQSFLSLAHSLGVSGFQQQNDKTPTKRKLEWGAGDGKEKQKEKAKPEKKVESRVLSPLCTPSKSRSEPASLRETALQCSTTKKRKLQTQSLTDNLENIEPIYLNLPRFMYETGSSFNANKNAMTSCDKDPLQSTSTFTSREEQGPHQTSANRVQRSVSSLIKLKASPFKDQTNHAPSSSCPVPPSPKSSTQNSSSQSGHSSNFSFDSHFLDPDDLAAKGATLLHHLAVWMIQQKKDSSQHYYQG